MDPEYTKLKAAPSVATVKSAAVPSIFSLFLATVKLFVSNVFAKSKNRTSSPTAGEAGKGNSKRHHPMYWQINLSPGKAV